MPLHPLENLLNAWIRSDPRPAADRGEHTRRHGFKRTNIERVTVVQLGGADPVKDLVQQEPSDAKNTIVGRFTSAVVNNPFDFSTVIQWGLADCWLLAAIMGAAQKDSTFFRNIIYADPTDASRVIVQFFWAGQIVRVHTTLLVSTGYIAGDPSNATSLILELEEKCGGLVRSGINTYAATNWGTVSQGLGMLGFDTKGLIYDPMQIYNALQAGGVVGICTAPNTLNAANWPISTHCYTVVSVDLAKKLIFLRNPYHGAIVFSIPFTDLNPALVASIDTGSLPSPLRLQAPVVVAAQTAAAPAAAVTYSRADLLKFYSVGVGGYPNTLGMAPTSSITIPNAAPCTVSVTVQEPDGVVTLNGVQVRAAGGVATFTNVSSVIVLTGKGGWYDVLSVTVTPTSTTASTLYTVTVTAPGGAPQTFSASKIVATLADGSPKTIPGAV